MNTLMRNTTLAFSRRRSDDYYSYEVLGHSSGIGEPGIIGGGGRGGSRAQRALSKRRKDQPYMMSSVSYRRDRAKKRQIFLRSYQLSSIGSHENSSSANSTSRRLKKAVVKVKSALVTIVAFARMDPFRSCAVSGPTAICGSSPKSVIESVRRK